ncbi:MAG: YcfL family protein [Desulfobacterales bacterium]|nr:YcfL family protein [Desulfobacterales bacterium]
MKRFYPLIVLVGLSLMLAACATKPPVDPRVSLVGGPLFVELTQVNSRLNSEGFLEVQVTGRNKTQNYKKLEYRVEWLDQSGFSLPSTITRWVPFPGFEGSQFRFNAVASHAKARDFRILIRKGN